MTCPKCGWHIREMAHFCPNCGAELERVVGNRICPSCHHEVSGHVTVCPACGASLAALAWVGRPSVSISVPLPEPARLLRMLAVVGGVAAIVVLAAFLWRTGQKAWSERQLAARPGDGAAATIPAVDQPSPAVVASPTDTPTETAMPTEPPLTETPEPPTAPPDTTPEPVVHVIRAGESLRAIAEQYGVTIAELAQANNMGATDLILVGQKLVIPSQAQPAPAPTEPPAPPPPATYVVKAGDTLVGIAIRFNVTQAALLAENGLTNGNLLRVGQELKIPGGALPTPTLAEPTPLPTDTPPPTEAPTATVADTVPAPTAAPAPTVAFEFPATNLLSPADGATIRGAEDVLVNWSSVGLLGDDTWYVVRFWRDDTALPTPPSGWTRTTAWRIPASYRPAANASSHRFYWSVTVMRVREGEPPVAVSPASQSRSFEWY